MNGDAFASMLSQRCFYSLAKHADNRVCESTWSDWTAILPSVRTMQMIFQLESQVWELENSDRNFLLSTSKHWPRSSICTLVSSPRLLGLRKSVFIPPPSPGCFWGGTLNVPSKSPACHLLRPLLGYSFYSLSPLLHSCSSQRSNPRVGFPHVWALWHHLTCSFGEMEHPDFVVLTYLTLSSIYI